MRLETRHPRLRGDGRTKADELQFVSVGSKHPAFAGFLHGAHKKGRAQTARPVQISVGSDCAGDPAFDAALRIGANLAVDHFAILEQQQRWNTAHAVL